MPDSNDKNDKKDFKPYNRVNLNFDKKMKMEFCHHHYCMADGAKYTYKRAQNELKLNDGETTADGLITIDKCGCLGHCGRGPNVKVTYEGSDKEEVAERTNAFRMGEMLKPYKAKQKRDAKDA